MTLLEDKKRFSDADKRPAERWLKEPKNARFRSICNVIKELDQKHPETHEYCMELIWMAKKITSKLTEYRNQVSEKNA
jgi:hypothetical protein